jgi:hypothetical protein
MTFVLKVDRLGSKAAIRGLAVGAERIHTLDLTARDYVSSAALPLRIPPAAAGPDGGAGGREDRSALPEKLLDVFISKTRVSDLASLLKVDIVQKLLPALQKEGYEETVDDRDARNQAGEEGRGASRPQQPQLPPAQPPAMPDPARPYPFDDPLAAPPRPRPAADFPPPEFEDEHEILRPARGIPRPDGRQPFGGLGHDDLHPPGLGPHDPLRPHFAGGIPGNPRPAMGGPHGGMHPSGLDDPLFGAPRGSGSGEFDPQVPPGARFDDPTGFGMGPRGNRGGSNPFGGGGFGGGGGII